MAISGLPKTKGPLVGSGPFVLLKMCGLERGGNGQAEGFARFPEQVSCSVGLNSFLVGVVACATRREQIAGNQLGRAALHVAAEADIVAEGPLIQPQRVISVIEAEGRVDDWHDDRNFGARGHARYEVGARDRPDVLLKSDLRSRDAALAGTIVVDRAAVEWSGQGGEASGLCFNWPWLVAASIPKSSKNEKVTGPAMGMRYSALVVRLVSHRWRRCRRPESAPGCTGSTADWSDRVERSRRPGW